MTRITIQEARNIASSRGGRCLSKKYINESSPLKWKCAKGHVWEAPMHNVKYSNAWCPECAGNKRKSIKDAKILAEKNNGKCLSTEYVNNKQKLKWQCECGNIFEMNFNSISNGQWCPKCARKKVKKAISLSIEDAQKIAAKRNGKCLSKEYTNNKTKLEWECDQGHRWKAKLHDIKDGNTWCPFCIKPSKKQQIINRTLKQLFGKNNIEYNYRKINWLRNTNGSKLELDIYVPFKKLAIEYDGRQHFEPVDWAGKGKSWAKNELKCIIKRDRRKDTLIQKHIKQGAADVEFFIRFNYKETIDRNNIIKKLIKAGVINE